MCRTTPAYTQASSAEGMTLKQYREHPFWKNLLEDFRWHYGQPAEVRRAFRVAMGLEAGDN